MRLLIVKMNKTIHFRCAHHAQSSLYMTCCTARAMPPTDANNRLRCGGGSEGDCDLVWLRWRVCSTQSAVSSSSSCEDKSPRRRLLCLDYARGVSGHLAHVASARPPSSAGIQRISHIITRGISQDYTLLPGYPPPRVPLWWRAGISDANDGSRNPSSEPNKNTYKEIR